MKKGYKSEWKIKKILENKGWLVVRSGGSLGYADLVCFKNGKCIFLQVKSAIRKKKIYYNGYMKDNIEGFSFYVVVDFGYRKIKIFKPEKILEENKGEWLENFCE